MVAHVLRLRADLFLGALRGDPGRVLRVVFAGLVLIAATIAVCVAAGVLGGQHRSIAEAVAILCGAALFLGAALAPVASGADDQLDPRRFALFGLDSRPLAGTLLLGSLVSAPTLALAAVSAAFAAMWTSRGVSGWVAWPMAIVGFATCVVVSRVCMALSATIAPQHRSREMTGMVVVAVLVIVLPVTVFLSSLRWNSAVPTQLADAVSFFSFTPLGAAWAVPAAISAGAGGAAIIHALIALATLGLLVLAWFALVDRLTSTIERPSGPQGREGLGWFALTPSTPGGAIAARSLVYWLRDRRYLVNVAIVPVVAVLAALPLLVAGVPAPIAALIPVPIIALFLGWMPHNDVAYDSTAVWMHIVSGVRGTADRLGRLVPIVVVALPLLAVGIAVTCALHGRWAIAPALVGATVSLFLCGLGLSSVSSVLAPYPVTRPGDSPFQQPQRAGSGSGSQGLVLGGAIVLSLPTLGYFWSAAAGHLDDSWTALWVGLATGLVVCAAGVLGGAVLFDRRGSRIMEFAEAV